MQTKILIFTSIALALNSLSLHAGCVGDELQFSFANIRATQAFSILSDFAGLDLEIDDTISASAPIKFDCMHWQDAASYLAEEYDLEVKIKNGVMLVQK